jgi:23S rRNA (guanosine2251-2'-O)-methyltransferase
MSELRKSSMEELGRISIPEYKQKEKIPVVIVLDSVRSLNNVGSAFRTADAFAIEKIILTGITGTPPHREIQKTALGATESVAWEYVVGIQEALQKLKREHYELIAIEQTNKSRSLHEFIPKANAKYCFVFGNEVEGVSHEALSLVEYSLEIPQSGTKHSLNISVCVGIVLWHAYKHIKFT